MNGDITVSREYFLALLRRAERVVSSTCSLWRLLTSVQEQLKTKNATTLPYDEYSRLQKADREFTALKSALIQAGTPIESIQVLINAALTVSTTSDEEKYITETKIPGADCTPRRLWSKRAFSASLLNRQTWRPEDSEPTTPTTVDDASESECEAEIPKQNFDDCHKNRSIAIKGVSVHTPLEIVLKSIRGGAILNIFRNFRNPSIHVAFIDPNAAEAFIRHVKKHGMYVKGKQIEVFWDEKQHYLKAGLARKIDIEGATRNLVIRFPSATITAETVREDLKHIHLLEVIASGLADGHIWISLNGVQHAVTARNCMRSRYVYKGLSIEFWPDDCAQPLLEITKSAIQSWKPKPQAMISTPSVNRFDGLLDCANEETSSESGSDA